jgi:putative molybdopterin biosynthesis protein
MADMAGVTRQAITAVETGQSDPSSWTALALALALGMSVEELFRSAIPVLSVAARPVAALGDQGARVTLAPMAEGYVALPLRDAMVSRAGFLPAGGPAGDADSDRAKTRKVQAIGPPRLTLVAAGCDPGLPLLEAPLGLLDPGRVTCCPPGGYGVRRGRLPPHPLGQSWSACAVVIAASLR